MKTFEEFNEATVSQWRSRGAAVGAVAGVGAAVALSPTLIGLGAGLAAYVGVAASASVLGDLFAGGVNVKYARELDKLVRDIAYALENSKPDRKLREKISRAQRIVKNLLKKSVDTLDDRSRYDDGRGALRGDLTQKEDVVMKWKHIQKYLDDVEKELK
ncbi:hypothetical protein VPHD479_0300 [Vibrio phage D479]